MLPGYHGLLGGTTASPAWSSRLPTLSRLAYIRDATILVWYAPGSTLLLDFTGSTPPQRMSCSDGRFFASTNFHLGVQRSSLKRDPHRLHTSSKNPIRHLELWDRFSRRMRSLVTFDMGAV